MEGSGGCIDIAGKAAIGKVRLDQELVGMAADGQVGVVGGRAVPTSAATPFRPLTDDGFYLLDGHLVVRSGDEVREAGPGNWVQFPAGVPHTFRVVDGRARILMVRADDGFLAAVRRIGRPVVDGDVPGTAPGPTGRDLDRAPGRSRVHRRGAAHEADEAERQLTGRAVR